MTLIENLRKEYPTSDFEINVFDSRLTVNVYTEVENIRPCNYNNNTSRITKLNRIFEKPIPKISKQNLFTLNVNIPLDFYSTMYDNLITNEVRGLMERHTR